LPVMPLERVVIEGALERTVFLVLLSTLHRSFTGDVLLIDRPDHAFLSAMAGGCPRVLYTLGKADIDFYVDINGLRERADETARRHFPDPIPTRLAEQSMRVLIAENDVRTVKSLTSVLADLGCESLVVHSGHEAVRLVSQRRPHVLLLGGRLPDIGGAELARFVKAIYSDYQPRTIIVSKHAEKPQSGIDGYLLKPVGFDQIAGAIF
jgi:CheY-like chemotaxis protein